MLGMIVRFIVSALVLMLVSYLVPGFTVFGFTGALIASIVIAVLGYIVELVIGKERTTRVARGFVGFLISAAVIYVSQWIVPNSIQVTLWGALLAALVIGIIDTFVPTELR